MRLQLEDAVIPADLPQLIRVCWAAFAAPHQNLFDVFNPVFGSGPHARDDAIEDAIRRATRRHQHDPSERWQKVIDLDADPAANIVAAALWNVYDENPFADYSPMDVYWWPEGPKRDYVNAVMELYDQPYVRLAAHPHVYLKIIFTDPEHRHRGAATMLLRSGLEKASQQGVDVWLDSWGLANEFYEKAGFTVVDAADIEPQSESESPPKEWRELDEKLQPLRKWLMRHKAGSSELIV